MARRIGLTGNGIELKIDGDLAVLDKNEIIISAKSELARHIEVKIGGKDITGYCTAIIVDTRTLDVVEGWHRAD